MANIFGVDELFSLVSGEHADEDQLIKSPDAGHSNLYLYHVSLSLLTLHEKKKIIM